METFNVLPNEIVLKILSLLPYEVLMQKASLVCTRWNYLIRNELYFGKFGFQLKINGEFDTEEKVQQALHRNYKHCKRLSLMNCPSDFLQNVLTLMLKNYPKIDILEFHNCDCSHVMYWQIPAAVKSVTIRNCKTSTKLWEVLSLAENTTGLEIPSVPTGFLPLILHNKPNLNHLEMGEIPNQLVYFICSVYQRTLTKFSFHGGLLTYSGVVSLLKCKDSLTHLRIREPKYLTKYSLKMLTNLTNLQSLELSWKGNVLISNPWNFEFCLDRTEQRVDPLFTNGSLSRLEKLDLSAFYQTVDNKLVQLVCLNHLSSQSETERHLVSINLSHCYQVSDCGIQWLVGSCHSTKLKRLDLSCTDLTGNCFLRSMSCLSALNLTACNSLTVNGVISIGSSCPNLRKFSLAMCKQLTDNDLQQIITLLRHLEDLDLSYTNIDGKCLKNVSKKLSFLNLNCCMRLKETPTMSQALNATEGLEQLNISGTKISGILFGQVLLPNLKFLYLDFSSNLDLQFLGERLQMSCPRLIRLSMFGTPTPADLDQHLDLSKKCKIITSDHSTSDEELRNYAKAKNLHLTNWKSTKQRMIRGLPFMLSPFWLRSLE